VANQVVNGSSSHQWNDAKQAMKVAKSMTQRKKEFRETYKDWIAEQQAQFDQHGLWCDGLVTWSGTADGPV
jgi:hypothetical protein